MSAGFDLVVRLDAEAQRRGALACVAQFDNPGTHSQYGTPYELTAGVVKPGMRVLDWGCGNGHFSLLLETLGAAVTGFSFEPRPCLLEGSPDFTFVPGRETEPRTLPFADNSFDGVFSVGVLEHVWETGGDEPSSLAELSRVLKPGGAFLTFHFPSSRGWTEPAFRLLGLTQYYHRRRYSASRIRELWADAGFDIVRMGTYNFLPRNQLRSLPHAVRSSRTIARLYNGIDRMLGGLLPW
ncbi:MAG: class I SAM-dependent methyltransferase, partial [Gemmatimonadaceae bacterium]